MRFDGAMLFAHDLARTEAFYREVMRLEPVEATRLEDWVEFSVGGTHFALHAIPAHEVLGSSPPTRREQAACKLTFVVDDLDAERARLQTLGVTILDRPWGGWDVVDPEGNILGVRAI